MSLSLSLSLSGGQHHLLTGPRLPPRPRDYLPPMSPTTRSEDIRYVRTPGDTQHFSESSDYIIPDNRPPQPLPSSPPTPSQVHDPHTSTHSPHHRVVTNSAYQTGRPYLKPKPNGVKGPSPPPEEGTAVDP